MNIMSQNLLLLVLSCLCFISPFTHASTHHSQRRKSYIVYMGELSKSKSLASVREEHHNLLSSVIGDEILARESIIHSYGKSFNAVAAKLLPHEAKRLMDSEKVVSVFESTIRKLHTTRSWSFLGMPDSSNHNVHNSSANKRLASESNMIIGMLDTGIYMAAPSFSDRGFGPIPRKWKGSCQRAVNFTGCNKKVIGAKSFRLDPQDPDDTPDTPLDMDGHGSHTASIAAGVRVRGASLYGVGKGNARGGVPNARIAVYKVCWGVGCSDVDILAGFDQAIFDGVDVMSVSIGGPSREFFLDVVSIGAFHAMKKGILTVCSAGNSGPYEGSVENVSPWLLTVGASSIDRKFVTGFKLGNGKSAYGMSINTFSPRKQAYPIVNGAQASKLSGSHIGNASACEYNTLGAEKVKGRIVYCLGASGQDYTVKTLGGAGTIMSAEEDKKMIAKMTQIPATIVKVKDGKYIDNYINSTLNPTAIIFKTKAMRMTAPFMASFSSRGPQKISPNILKPDIAAPGLNILAAYTKLISITGYANDRRFSAFNIMSGTSMACPHVTAAAAYVKSFHPDWSASAIKSALMTTATPMRVKEKGGELGAGAGQLNPTAALHPGLVYDLRMSSYIRFLCKEGYNSTTIGRLLGGKAKHDCSDYKHALGVDGLNYPSMHVNVGKSKTPINAVFYRTVTYQGTGKAKFKATVNSLKGLTILVAPNTLEFDHGHQRRSFKVIVKGNAFRKGDSPVVSAALVWKNLDDPKIVVRSPIVVYRQISRH